MTAFGTQDAASSFFRYLKFAIGLSYEVTDKLSFGIAPSVGYSDVSLRLFPGTSVPPSAGLPNGFTGFSIRDRCARNGGLGGLWAMTTLPMSCLGSRSAPCTGLFLG